MERFSQFRDRGSGIAPFLPIPTEPAGLHLPFHIFLYVFRVPLLLTVTLTYFLFLQWLPIGVLGKKAALWSILGVPGIWWIDLQIDGVKKGSLNKNNARLPQDNSIIAASCTSPIDALYLAAIFDPVFTASFPTTRLVQPITLFQAMLRAFLPPQQKPHRKARLMQLDAVLSRYQGRVIVVFPECTTSNGRGILPLSPSLLTAPPRTKVFPVHLRYTAPDITTPIPGSFFTFLWNLCSKPSHLIRIRIAEAVFNTSLAQQSISSASSAETLVGDDNNGPVTTEEKAFLDKIGEALARLGRVRRVALGVKEKQDFLNAWTKSRRR